MAYRGVRERGKPGFDPAAGAISRECFIEEAPEGRQLGRYGREYWPERELETLLEIMCGRNVGLRSLLYALSVGPMTIEEISDQQLNTHPELGWNPKQTDMAKQRAN